jgi:hypothetical protein
MMEAGNRFAFSDGKIASVFLCHAYLVYNLNTSVNSQSSSQDECEFAQKTRRGGLLSKNRRAKGWVYGIAAPCPVRGRVPQNKRNLGYNDAYSKFITVEWYT